MTKLVPSRLAAWHCAAREGGRQPCSAAAAAHGRAEYQFVRLLAQATWRWAVELDDSPNALLRSSVRHRRIHKTVHIMNVILLVKNMQRPMKIHLTLARAALMVGLCLMPVALAAYAGF